MVSGHPAEDDDGVESTTGVKRISVVPTQMGGVPELDHAIVGSTRPEPAPVAKRRLEPQTGKTLIDNGVPEPTATIRSWLEPQTGKTLVNQPVPEPVPAARHGLEPQTGKTLINQPIPEPAPAAIPEPVPVGRHGLEPQTGKTLINQPVPGSTPPPASDLKRPTNDAPLDLPIPGPPESNRLAGRHTPPSSVPRSNRSTWVGGYEVLARLRRSTRGTEYLCRPGDDSQARYTLMVLRRQLLTGAERDTFLRDANRLAKRAHPYLLGLADAGIYQQQPYLVRTRCAGATLAQLLESTPPSSREPRILLRIFEEALEALAHAHERQPIGEQSVGFVHGELTVDELLVTTTGRTLVTGVGEATLLRADATDPSQDLLALGIIINTALAGGVDEGLLRTRWLADARAGRHAQAADLLREFRRLKSRAGVFARREEVAAWVARVRRGSRDRPSSAPTVRESFPSLVPDAPPNRPPPGWLDAVRSWWTRRPR